MICLRLETQPMTAGKFEFTCHHCGCKRVSFGFVPERCSSCNVTQVDVKKLLNHASARVRWHRHSTYKEIAEDYESAHYGIC